MKALLSALGVVAVLAAALGAGDAYAIYNRATFDRLASGTAHKPSATCSKLRQRHKPLPARCRKKAPPVPPPAPTPPAAPLTRAGTVAATIPIESPTFLRQLNGSLWVGSLRGTLTRVDPQTNAVTATVPIDCGVQETEGTAALAECPYLAFGAGRIWVSDFDKALIYLVDPDAAKVVTTLSTNDSKLTHHDCGPCDTPGDIGPEGIDFAAGSAWVANHHGGTIVRIDTATNKLVASIRVTHAGLGGPQFVATGAGAVWTTVPNRDSVVRINPLTNEVVANIPVGGDACGGTVLPTDDAVWVADCASQVTRIDPKTNTVVANVGLPRGASAYDLAVGFGSVWAVTNKGLLFRIDPATNTATGELMLTGAEGDTPVGGGVTVAFGSVWASTNGGNTLLRITPGQ
jgi:virginiamycin B lyase